MTATTPLRSTPPARRDSETHLFAIGQSVRLRGGFGMYPSKSGDIYRITATLPPYGNALQYRIHNENEHYERVTTEDNLQPVVSAPLGEDAALLEQTFSHG